MTAHTRLVPARQAGSLAFVDAGLLFLGASAVAAGWNAAEPFAHGWWFVSFLALVGGIAQLLLGAGHASLTRHGGGARTRWSPQRLAMLWNAGTLLVPLGVLAETRLGVVIGSVVLLAALGGLSLELCGAPSLNPGWASRGRVAYSGRLAFLAASVLVGTALAWHLPWT